MQPKSYEILIDIKRGLMNNQIIEVVTGDFGMNNFKFKLLRDRLVPYDLTNTIVRIMAVTPSGSEQQQDCIVENPAGGTLDLTLKQSLFAESGAYVAELQVYDKDTQVLRVTFPRFDYYVRKSLQSDETVQASDEYSILQQMINDVGDINDNINGRVEAHNTNETSHENIIGLLSSLTTDEKANLVSAINEVKSQSNENATDLSTHMVDDVSFATSFIRDLSITGNQEISLPLTPKVVFLYGVVPGTEKWAKGSATENGQNSISALSSTNTQFSTSRGISFFGSEFTDNTRGLITFGNKKITINWTHLGVGAVGTAQILLSVMKHGED